LTDALFYADISQAANKADVPILVGAVIENPANSEQVLNAGILWEPNKGPTQLYIKQNPVMFGEFVPFRGLLTSLIGRFERVPRDFAKGDSPGVFNIAGKQVGDVICFEVANDAVVRNTVRAGAQTLVIQTNNATYNLLGQTEQQLQIGRVRAREFDRFVLVSALSGISAVVSNEGKVLEMAGEFESAILEANVPLIERQTLSARFGHSITLLIFTLGVLSITLGASLSFVNRR
jgi:apolipoprotein N-acyltransferase